MNTRISVLYAALRAVRERRGLINGMEIMSADPNHPLSGLRTLRKLREEGLLDYEVVNAQSSRYRILTHAGDLEKAIAQEKRKVKGGRPRTAQVSVWR